ncbi:metal-dependent hydrolase [Salinisphaera sp. Q1T1-3]|uniref:metal-dependent hydrolase n=1 Tax=Salinisphaera sp. Q1T1-3 TaxID=2321229 RepID=UPI000E713648|nr:metal-dependent hydrolase [Salinisphaera sp. Q1T1-3]RJS92420.1 hypothetical protein D3260_12195 [Salinisphaera sp. Q1T1-3]
MANFRTHLTVAAGVGAAATSYGLYAGWWTLVHAPSLVLLTTLGGIMPDIDADKSHSVRLIFTVLAVVAAFIALSIGRGYLSTMGVLCLALGLYIAIRDGVSVGFRMTTRHRASWHSLLATAGVTVATSVISYRFFAQPARAAWLDGGAMALGMVVHLLLDECFAIDLEGARLKRSFGTALKLFDYRRPIATVLMAGAAIALVPWLPPWPAAFGTATRALQAALGGSQPGA